MQRNRRVTNYVLALETKSGLWYVHPRGYPYIVAEGFFKDKQIAREYLKMRNFLPNKVEQIETAAQRERLDEVESA